MNQYYILSIKWSSRNHYVWWGSNNSGYTPDIEKAGIYSEETINGNKSYYINTNTMPVPVKLVEQAEKQTVVVNEYFNADLFGIREHLKTAKEY